VPGKDDLKKAFDFAADVRKFEIGLFWQRSLFFWGFITTATAAFGAAYQTSNRNLQFAVAAIGLTSAFVWTLVNRRSLYWQRHWEKELESLQKGAIDYEIYGHEANRRITIEQGWLWKPMHYSVSKLLLAFSDFVVLAWAGVAFISSPLWPLLHDAPALSWLRTPNAKAILISTITTAYLVIILIRARPDRIPPQSN
jgi:hypothetical protein